MRAYPLVLKTIGSCLQERQHHYRNRRRRYVFLCLCGLLYIANIVFFVALYLYEYFLTLSKEVQCVWRRKLSVASILFILNRYVVLCNRMIRLVQAVSWAGFTETEADRVSPMYFRVVHELTIARCLCPSSSFHYPSAYFGITVAASFGDSSNPPH